ncbi:hypothetical protein [Lysinibacillus fusiformis]|uniref:hypothetical protein n=1 Tax=Lysinibacillus fusiformis TaxID=28031 RepID=UPI0018E653F7|nr:hypothetical protein [Lysinibacillus fusiformis]MBI6865215.1 hypothetical protein [Lysinibacillus fusiformis]
MELNELIEMYNSYIKNVPNGATYIAEKLREDELTSALVSIKDFSEGIMWLTQASELINSNRGKVVLEVERLQEFLLEVNDGLERQDYVVVADMFEYEIAPFFEEITLAEAPVQ